ncbi:MAG: 1-acyl-sn-glycerol-3-phosphate acyltransferase, partial [Chloroflexi bacterium]|nr:1-acyl-sn-glycerol-3-phosphate acyltransferase [Chloroflexota bacterium]
MEDEFKSDAAVLVQNAFRGLLAVLFYLGPSVTHDVVIHGREHVTDFHPKVIVSNHKRELDSFVLQGVMYLARGVFDPDELLAFALREDALWPGFLANFIHLSGRSGRWLARLDLSPVIHLLKAYPMGMLRSRADRARVQAQLAEFARVLDRGHDLYWAPEGGLGLDGHLEPFRAGLHRVVEASHASLRILPVAIMYDFMTSRRTRCLIRIGPEFEVERSWPRRDLDDYVRRALLRQ